MRKEEFKILSDKISQAVHRINSLKEEKNKLSGLLEKQKEDLSFFQKENRQTQKLITQNQRLEKDKEKVKETIQILLERLEKAGI